MQGLKKINNNLQHMFLKKLLENVLVQSKRENQERSYRNQEQEIQYNKVVEKFSITMRGSPRWRALQELGD